MQRSIERLSHFACDHCQRWWSIGDAPADRTEWFCPWCGKTNTETAAQEFDETGSPVGERFEDFLVELGIRDEVYGAAAAAIPEAGEGK